jgi:hypothetical protein
LVWFRVATPGVGAAAVAAAKAAAKALSAEEAYRLRASAAAFAVPEVPLPGEFGGRVSAAARGLSPGRRGL